MRTEGPLMLRKGVEGTELHLTDLHMSRHSIYLWNTYFCNTDV